MIVKETEKQAFIMECLTPKERLFLSNPMNTEHEKMFRCWKIGRSSK